MHKNGFLNLPAPFLYILLVIPTPPGWQNADQIFGVPHLLLGPLKNGFRPSIQVYELRDRDVLLSDDYTLEEFSKYGESKRKNIESRGGKLISVEPFAKRELANGWMIHEAGSRYRMGERELAEKSIFLQCGKRWLYSMSLTDIVTKPENTEIFEKIYRGLPCGEK